VSFVASDTSIEDALEPVRLFEGIGERGCDVGSRFAVQTPNLDKPGTSGHIPERASQVPSGLSVVVRTPPTRSLTSGKRQPPDSDVVHCDIQLREHQIGPVACIGFPIGARHMEHTGMTERGETVGGSPRGSQLITSGGSTKMISDGCTDADREVWSSASARTCCQRPNRGELGGRALR
jgi:hypothetical protein